MYLITDYNLLVEYWYFLHKNLIILGIFLRVLAYLYTVQVFVSRFQNYILQNEHCEHKFTKFKNLNINYTILNFND